jgi:ferredoxin
MSITLSDPDLPSVKIRISNDKCKTPMACPSPCYRLCPQGVFVLAANPAKVAKKWTSIDPNTPGDYMVMAPMVPKCIGCNVCVENCPTGALKIKYKAKTTDSEPEKNE